MRHALVLRLLPLLAVLCGALAAPSAFAAWPDDQPIRIIVPQAPGGTNDTVARTIATELSRILRQSVVVENRAGASGAIGTQEATQARPDGYTLVMASDSTALLDVLRPKLTWKFERDLRAIAMVGDQPISVAVSARSPYTSFADIVKGARQNPDRIPYGTSGVGTSQHVVGEWLAKLAGVQLVHIPYKGGGQATSDLLSGQVAVAVLGLAPMLAQQKNGGVRIVAITSAKRNAAVPDVPTLTELGYPKIALTQWVGVMAPARTPEPVVKRLSDAMQQVLAQPDVSKRLADSGIEPRPMASGPFATFLHGYIDQWRQVVPTLNLTLD